MISVLSAGALRAHLLAARLAGPVATTREKSLGRYRLFVARDPRVLSGLVPAGEWTVPRLLRLMAAECGVSADPGRVSGRDTIDPERTIAGLDAFARRLEEAMARRTPVLLGTGHPHRLLRFYATLAAAFAAAGCAVLTPPHGRSIDITTRFGLRPHLLTSVGGVVVVREPGVRSGPDAVGVHTHSPLPLRAALDGLIRAGQSPPGLVIGDHGWLCGAGQLGIEAIGPADTDDPAAFVGKAEGQVSVVVPVDDGVYADYYRPLTRYVLNKVLQ
jgi:hypothetical protein